MQRESHAIWLALVEKAAPGDEYKYEITNRDNTYQRVDPRARGVTNSAGHGIIIDPEFDWQGGDFTMPSWN